MTEPRRSIGAVRNPDSERAILDAAKTLLLEQGIAGFSIEGVARRAKAGKPTIYRWWPTKAALLLDLYIRIKGELQDPPPGEIRDVVFGFLRNLIRFWRGSDAGPLYRSVLGQSQTDPEAHRALLGYHEGRLDRTGQLFADALPDRDFSRGRRLAEAACSIALVRLMMDKLDIEDAELRALTDQLVAGV